MSQWHDGSAALQQDILPYNTSYLADNDNRLNILVVEDDYNDTLMTVRAVKSAQIPCNLDRMTRGNEVMPYLRNCMQANLPDVLLLDMGLPDITGFEILALLADAPAIIRAIPIIIVTGYSHFEYLPKAYQLPIMGYVTKPVRAKELEPILTMIMGFK